MRWFETAVNPNLCGLPLVYWNPKLQTAACVEYICWLETALCLDTYWRELIFFQKALCGAMSWVYQYPESFHLDMRPLLRLKTELNTASRVWNSARILQREDQRGGFDPSRGLSFVQTQTSLIEYWRLIYCVHIALKTEDWYIAKDWFIMLWPICHILCCDWYISYIEDWLLR